MTLKWINESPSYWNADKSRIIAGAPVGVFDVRFGRMNDGDRMSGEWWRAEDDNRTVGYGWLDVVWGDAEILLATDGEAKGKGVGTFILENLEAEAKKKGLNYLYNLVRPTHPDKEQISGWLTKRGFRAKEDGSLVRTITKKA